MDFFHSKVASGGNRPEINKPPNLFGNYTGFTCRRTVFGTSTRTQAILCGMSISDNSVCEIHTNRYVRTFCKSPTSVRPADLGGAPLYRRF